MQTEITIQDCPLALQNEVDLRINMNPNAKVLTVQKWGGGITDDWEHKYAVWIESGSTFEICRLYQGRQGNDDFSMKHDSVNAGEIIEFASYSEFLQRFLKIRR
ncbi:hypothetical protein [Paenibacillus hubeiensis]|uniref:hypothetical protein n=1 Tax=Paenibacillus hubeiensis TaxID=3077330 RepID=UPI0031BAFBBA